jgi:hypothetical protein
MPLPLLAGGEMGQIDRDRAVFTGCPQTHKPCPLVFAFLARLTHAMECAQKVTGQYPDMAGQICMNDCPFGQACQLSWQGRDGIVSVDDGARQILQMPLCKAGAA